MRIKFITFGCSRNVADTELMQGLLKKEGHELVNAGEEVTVVNTCFVKLETEKKIIDLLHELKGRVIVTGCLAQARPSLIEAFPKYSFLGVGKLERITEAVRKQVIDTSAGEPDFCIERVKVNPLISIIPISEGCLGSCTYCCTKQARGDLKSRPISNILTQARNDLSKGAKEVWLTGQDNGCYGFDLKKSDKTNLALLINELVKLPYEFMIRVGMMNPQHVLRILPELILAFKNPKVYKFIHVPVQSGSNKVLKDMHRNYSINDFKKVINEFRKAFPEISVSTDVICAYPTEGELEWTETLKLISEVKPDIININRFFSRPGTIASGLKQQASRIAKDRSRELTKLHRPIGLSLNKKLINKTLPVLVSAKGIARTMNYKQVFLKARTGIFCKARIINATVFGLEGKISH